MSSKTAGTDEVSTSFLAAESKPALATLLGTSINLLVIVIGIILVSAGLLKISSLAPAFDHSLLQSSARTPFLFAVALSELCLGAWLISGVGLRFSIKLAALFFVCTSAYGFYLIQIGESTCACFGALRTPVSMTFGLSIICFMAMLVTNVVFTRVQRISYQLDTTWLISIMGGGLLLVALGDAAIPSFSISRLIDRINGNTLTAVVVSKGVQVNYFQELAATVSVEVRNESATSAVEIVTCEHGCGAFCTLVDTPILVPPQSKVIVRIRITRPGIAEDLYDEAVVQYYKKRNIPVNILEPFNVPIQLVTRDRELTKIPSQIRFEPSFDFLFEWEQIRSSLVSSGELSGVQ